MNIRSRVPRFLQLAMVVVMTALAVPAVATAQVSTPVVPVSDLPRTITVTGTGSVEMTPDTADVNFAIYTQGESLDVAQDENTTRLETVMQAFADAGIADEDITTSGYSVRVINEYDRDGNLVGVKGYEVWVSVTVTIRDIESVGSLLDAAVGAGANEVNSISFYVDDTEAAASQARSEAIEDARTKADEMAEAAGVLVVGVYSIEETESPPPNETPYYAMEASRDTAGAGGAASMNVPVSPGQASITVKVQVVFEIEQPQG